MMHHEDEVQKMC